MVLCVWTITVYVCMCVCNDVCVCVLQITAYNRRSFKTARHNLVINIMGNEGKTSRALRACVLKSAPIERARVSFTKNCVIPPWNS